MSAAMYLFEYMAGDPTVACRLIGHYCKDVPSFGKQSEAGRANDLTLINPDEEADWSPTYCAHKNKESP
jgi:hypothetical protein